MLEQFKYYFNQAKKKQENKWLGGNHIIECPLVDNVPIYDVIHRRFAAFSSFPEAVYHKENDPKGNGIHFLGASVPKEDFLFMCYLFRLCGSGINYKSSHGFGNFWIVKEIKNKGIYRKETWLENIPERGFSDSKGYLLPMISKGLRSFIIDDSYELFTHVMSNIRQGGMDIPMVVKCGNEWLRSRGFKRQNFVLTAFAMDIVEYTNLIPKDTDVLCGSNAKKCLKLIFDQARIDENECLQILIDETGGYNNKYDMEDVACDFIRYINNFQSPDHIRANLGQVYENAL